jgi:AcrR family transcriptional regulator
MNQDLSPPTGTRDRILATARTLFAARGYEATSIRDITRTAQVNLGAVTYHFGSKQALYEAVIASFVDPLRARFDAAVAADGSTLDRIERVVQAFFEHFRGQPEQPALMLHELAREGPLPRPIQEWIQYVLATLTRLVAEGQAEGAIVEGSPLLLTVTIIAQPFFFALTRHPMERIPGLQTMPAADPDAVRVACAVLRRGLCAPGRNS